MENYPEISIILPCLNEEQAIGFCLDKIKEVIEKNNLNAEIIVVDNGSTDNSRNIIKGKQARLVEEKERGYGSAYLRGFEVAGGKYIFMADSDGSYDFNEIPNFIEYLRQGYDFVIGDRFKGKVEKEAMPWVHKYIGNPALSGVLRIFFNTKIHDVHCGMRAFRKDLLKQLNLKTTGMEFASEMIIKTIKNNLKIKEVPINYYARKGESKLKSLTDGWRHLRFMLLYSPLFLFFIPGFFLFLVGFVSLFWLYFGSPEILGMKLYNYPMFLSALLVIIGYQLIIFALFAKTYAVFHLGDRPVSGKIYKYITIERASIFGIVITLLGAIIYITIFLKWLNDGFGALQELKNSIIALTLIIAGIQTIFSSFMLSILAIKEK
ncbi:MAG: glycosyltransferase [Patescibacteria group bacterium]